MKRRVLKEAVSFKDRVNNVDAVFVKRTIKSHPEYGRRAKEDPADNEVELLLKNENWDTIRGVQQLFKAFQAEKMVMFSTFDEDFYRFANAINRKMKGEEKLWIGISGYSGYAFDREETFRKREAPSEEDLEKIRSSYYNYIFLPYDALTFAGKPKTWDEAHNAWDKWLRETTLETKKEYLDDAFLGELGYLK